MELENGFFASLLSIKSLRVSSNMLQLPHGDTRTQSVSGIVPEHQFIDSETDRGKDAFSSSSGDVLHHIYTCNNACFSDLYPGNFLSPREDWEA